MLLQETLDATTTARICADGCLVADVKVARIGIQDYAGREVDPDNAHGMRDKAAVKVYRPAEEVFSDDSLKSLLTSPFTIDHPSEPVTADNWRKLGVGEINGVVSHDRRFVYAPIIVRDAPAVEKVRTTHKQLSAGYACQLDFTPGTFEDEAYDAIQRDIRFNHIAAVPAARGGPELRISDERPQIRETDVKTITLDGLKVDLSDAEAVQAAIAKLQGKATDAETKLKDAEGQVATLTTEKATLDAKVVTLEKQIEDAKLTPAQLRDAAKAYQAVVDKAKALGVEIADDADEVSVMKAVVDAKLGDAAKDWNETQIAASFATLTKDAKVEQHDPLRKPVVANDSAVADAYKEMVDDMVKASQPKTQAA